MKTGDIYVYSPKQRAGCCFQRFIGEKVKILSIHKMDLIKIESINYPLKMWITCRDSLIFQKNHPHTNIFK